MMEPFYLLQAANRLVSDASRKVASVVQQSCPFTCVDTLFKTQGSVKDSCGVGSLCLCSRRCCVYDLKSQSLWNLA